VSDDEPTPRRIALEIAVYAAVVLAVGALFVGLRVMREGTRVLSGIPHAQRDDETPRDESRTGGPKNEESTYDGPPLVERR
jgi:hypothetical protein